MNQLIEQINLPSDAVDAARLINKLLECDESEREGNPANDFRLRARWTPMTRVLVMYLIFSAWLRESSLGLSSWRTLRRSP